MGRYTIELVGESYYQLAIRRCSSGDAVRLEAEPDNAFDPRAVRVVDVSGSVIGYLPRDSWLSRVVLDDPTPVRAAIGAIVGGEPDRPMLGVILAVLTGADAAGRQPPAEEASAGLAVAGDPLHPRPTGFVEAVDGFFESVRTKRAEKRAPNSFESCLGCMGTVVAVLILFAVLGQCSSDRADAAAPALAWVQAP